MRRSGAFVVVVAVGLTFGAQSASAAGINTTRANIKNSSVDARGVSLTDPAVPDAVISRELGISLRFGGISWVRLV